MVENEREEMLKVLDWMKGIDDGVDKSFGHPVKGTKWFIVSTKWLNKWKKINRLTDELLEDEMDEDLGEIDSEDIIDFATEAKISLNYILKPGLAIGRDYEILPKKAWLYLSNKYNFKHKIIRKSIEVNNDETQIEITLFPLHVVFASKKGLKPDIPQVFQVSRTQPLSVVVDMLESEIPQGQQHYYSRLWKLENGTSLSDLKDLMDTEKKPLIFPGILLDNKYEPINKFELCHTDILVLESKPGYGSFELFKEKEKELCEGCRRYSYGGRRCECKKYYYCNDMCEEKDRNFHYCRKSKKIYNLTEASCIGKVGLQNLGNTCYMNSGLQCLSLTYGLTRYILDDLYLNDINSENLLGSKGELVNEFAALIKEMWYGTSRCVSPWGLKRAFSDFAKQFIGFFQQDSQEMLSFLIDGIHEDLNRVKIKPPVTDPDPEGLSEQELAQKYWQNHLDRNDSIIVDLMHGQYRSEVECPKCHKISLAFDPFLMLTLPIPEKSLKIVDFVHIGNTKNTKCKVSVPKGTNAGGFKVKACELLKIDPDQVLMAETNMGSLKCILSETSKISKRSTIMLYSKPTEAEDNIEEFDQVFCDFRKKSYGYSASIVGQPRILAVPRNISFKDLYRFVFEYILKLKSETPDDLEEAFREKFSSFFTKNYADNFFSLKIHNPFQFPCALCDRISCPGCQIPFEDKNLFKFISNCKEPNLRISVNFEQHLDTGFLSNVEIHENYYSSHDNKNQETIDISECFDMFSRKEQLDEMNTTYCSRCKEHLQGIKKMDIFRLPKTLVIHFKRFKQKGYFSSKNNKLVEFPLEGLDMSRFSLNCTGIYDLYAVSNHYGSLEGGHYTAYGKLQDGIWRDFDDSSVSVVTHVKEHIVASSAYVLFYQRREI